MELETVVSHQCGWWESNLGPLGEQPMFIILEPTLEPQQSQMVTGPLALHRVPLHRTHRSKYVIAPSTKVGVGKLNPQTALMLTSSRIQLCKPRRGGSVQKTDVTDFTNDQSWSSTWGLPAISVLSDHWDVTSQTGFLNPYVKTKNEPFLFRNLTLSLLDTGQTLAIKFLMS